MDISTFTLDDQVDITLHKIALSPNLTLGIHDLYDVPVMDEMTYRLDHFMLERGLLKIVGESRSITGKGLEIANFGGWVAYQRLLRKDNPRHLHTIESVHRKHNQEIYSLKKELESLRQEVKSRDEKELANSKIIHNLIEQRRITRVMIFVGGIVSGLLLSSLLWFMLF